MGKDAGPRPCLGSLKVGRKLVGNELTEEGVEFKNGSP